MDESKKTASYSLTAWLVESVASEAGERGENKSDVVERALREYFGQSGEKTNRQLLEEIHAVTTGGPTPSERDTPKKKDSVGDDEQGGDATDADESNEDESTDTVEIPDEGPVPDEVLREGPLEIDGNQTGGKADRVANYLALTHRDLRHIEDTDIENAIARLFERTDHYMSKYPPLVKERLPACGYHYFKPNEAWYPENAYRNMVEKVGLGAIENLQTPPDEVDPEELEDDTELPNWYANNLNTVQDMSDDLVRYDFVDGDDIEDAIDSGKANISESV